jgi:hypothetical protein
MSEIITEVGSHRRRLIDLLRQYPGRVPLASPYLTDANLLPSPRDREVRLLTSLSIQDFAYG